MVGGHQLHGCTPQRGPLLDCQHHNTGQENQPLAQFYRYTEESYSHSFQHPSFTVAPSRTSWPAASPCCRSGTASPLPLGHLQAWAHQNSPLHPGDPHPLITQLPQCTARERIYGPGPAGWRRVSSTWTLCSSPIAFMSPAQWHPTHLLYICHICHFLSWFTHHICTSSHPIVSLVMLLDLWPTFISYRMDYATTAL